MTDIYILVYLWFIIQQNTIDMEGKKSVKCDVAGCKFTHTYGIKTNWGTGTGMMHSCRAHAPAWIVQGKTESPEATIFGIKKSWYTLAYSL